MYSAFPPPFARAPRTYAPAPVSVLGMVALVTLYAIFALVLCAAAFVYITDRRRPAAPEPEAEPTAEPAETADRMTGPAPGRLTKYFDRSTLDN